MQPVILAHGFLGYRRFLVWELFNGVLKAFEKQGITTYQPLVHPTASIAQRACLLQEFIDREIGVEEPIHIIAHSMGGLDARYYLSPNGLNQGHRVISLTTISTPHRGSCLAEYIKKPYIKAFSLGARLCRVIAHDEESRSFLCEVADETWDAVEQLTPRYLQEIFNPHIIDHPQVRYSSYAGLRPKSRFLLLELVRGGPEYIIRPREGENDGMVSVESAQWGEFKGILPADHGEQIGLIINPWQKQTFDHIGFFLSIAQDLEKLEEEMAVKVQ